MFKLKHMLYWYPYYDFLVVCVRKMVELDHVWRIRNMYVYMAMYVVEEIDGVFGCVYYMVYDCVVFIHWRKRRENEIHIFILWYWFVKRRGVWMVYDCVVFILSRSAFQNTWKRSRDKSQRRIYTRKIPHYTC